MKAKEIIQLCEGVIGDGFDIPCDLDGWVYKCSECDTARAGYNNDPEHKEDCKRGAAIKAIEDYLY